MYNKSTQRVYDGHLVTIPMTDRHTDRQTEWRGQKYNAFRHNKHLDRALVLRVKHNKNHKLQ